MSDTLLNLMADNSSLKYGTARSYKAMLCWYGYTLKH